MQIETDTLPDNDDTRPGRPSTTPDAFELLRSATTAEGMPVEWLIDRLYDRTSNLAGEL